MHDSLETPASQGSVAGADHHAGAGRSCPLNYRYDPREFAGEAPHEFHGLDVLYVVGGLYGNEVALHEVLRLFERESGRKRLVFNGDFHWFDVDPGVFARVQREVLAHTALRGNVETELANDAASDETGCGCAYPDWVGDATVERSNRILRRLRGATTVAQRAELATLPMWQRADVGNLRLGLVHGDAQSLAGWGFAQEHLRDPEHRDGVRGWFHAARVDAFACTHTCLPVFQSLRLPDQRHGWVFNNGSAGMPNFQGDGAGLLTRVALRPFDGLQRRFGVRHGETYIDALSIEIDSAEVQRRFLAQWPLGSDAHDSYFHRIARGPEYTPSDAIRLED
ncbi:MULTISPECIES: hypothetical protein [unclassified Variovorax]|uniref:hypothetical protein n=1 Tax=unclassified Variovorax TaxID=663243 RepID=UPI003ED0C398